MDAVGDPAPLKSRRVPDEGAPSDSSGAQVDRAPAPLCRVVHKSAVDNGDSPPKGRPTRSDGASVLAGTVPLKNTVLEQCITSRSMAWIVVYRTTEQHRRIPAKNTIDEICTSIADPRAATAGILENIIGVAPHDRASVYDGPREGTYHADDVIAVLAVANETNPIVFGQVTGQDRLVLSYVSFVRVE